MKKNHRHTPDDAVLTPGGYRSRAEVHEVRAGEAVTHDPDGTMRIQTQQTLIKPSQKRSSDMSSNLVLTPGGYRDASLVHRVDAGFAVHVNEGAPRLLHLETKRIIDLPPASTRPGQVPGFGTGWIAYGFWVNNSGSPVTSFRTRWKVPPAPTKQESQTIFLFNGIDPANPSQAILQPVLQWGTSHAGGGGYWSVASWYVLGTGQAFFTPLVRVNEGDELVGVMKLTGQSNGSFSYTSEFEGIPGTSLPVLNVAELVWLNETLEVYGIDSCANYPNSTFTGMREIAIETKVGAPAATWSPVDLVTDCGQHATVVSSSATNGEVDLYYKQAPVVIDFGRYLQYIDILFGVIHGEGGIGIVNGHVIKIPPRSPDWLLFASIAKGMSKVQQGFGVRNLAGGEGGMDAQRLGLRLMQQGLEESLKSVTAQINEL